MLNIANAFFSITVEGRDTLGLVTSGICRIPGSVLCGPTGEFGAVPVLLGESTLIQYVDDIHGSLIMQSYLSYDRIWHMAETFSC